MTIRRQPIAVWYDDDSRLLRRRSRTLEKHYRRSGLASDQLEWVRHERERHRINQIKENGYWALAVGENTGHPRKLPFPPSWAWVGLVTLLPVVERHKASRTISSRRPMTSVSQPEILHLLPGSHHPLLCLKSSSSTAQRSLESRSS